MRIQIASDLHLEFKGPRFDFNSVERDILVLAGDIDLGSKADEFILNELKISDVIYLLGNHELYHQVVPRLRWAWKGPIEKRINEEAEALGYPGRLHFLENKEAIIQGVRFLGCTLWTDFDGGDLSHMHFCEQRMNDYHCSIMRKTDDGWAGGNVMLSAQDTYAWHRESIAFLKEELAKPFEGKTVVTTHHLPSFRSCPNRFDGSIMNYAFASDLDSFIEESGPDIWIHGHTHDNCDYKIGNTWVLCNPRGYHGHEINPGFRDDFVVEV